MATIVYFDSANSGTRDGTTPATAYNNTDFQTYDFAKASAYEFKFANGSTFTFGTSQRETTTASGSLLFTNYDRGDGNATLPIFTAFTV